MVRERDPLQQGDAAVIAVNHRPRRGARGLFPRHADDMASAR